MKIEQMSLDEFEQSLIDDANGLVPGSEELRRQVDAISQLVKAKAEEKRTKNEKKEVFLKAVADITKIVGLGVVYVWAVIRVTKFEEDGSVTSRALNVAPKIPFFK